ncbi:MAG: ribosome recycling factor [Phycisphaerales bacterium]|nr:ribosome recycling factor [Phycisphaerales bacterium]
MDPDTILLTAEEAMTKGIEHLKKELHGIRTGRASPSLIEFIKVEYYGSMSDLKNIAAISVPEATQLLIKPFDKGAINDIRKAIEGSGLGLVPNSDGQQIRINLPALSGDRRKQLSAHCKKLAEETKVHLRNARRDANKSADSIKASLPEAELETLKEEVQELLKKYETETDALVVKKQKDIETV